MAALQPSYIPLLNPDRRPLPTGWTQHYDPDRKIWIYLDMTALPPRATLTHPAGPLNTPPKRIVTQGRAPTSMYSPWAAPTSIPIKTSVQTHGEKQDKNQTLAQRLYSSALPPTEKAGIDEFGMQAGIDTDEIAPSYGSLDTSTYFPTDTPASAAVLSTPPEKSGVIPIRRRPLPQTPSSSSTTRPTMRRLPRPVDQNIPEKSNQGPLQPTPVRPTNGRLGLHVAAPAPYKSTSKEEEVFQNSNSMLRAKPPSYTTATRPPALRYRTSPQVPSIAENRPAMFTSNSRGVLSSSLQPAASFHDAQAWPNDRKSAAGSTTSNDPPQLSASLISSPFPSANSMTTSRPSPFQPMASTLSIPTPSRSSPGPTRVHSSAPSTPEPTRLPFSPNRKPPRDSFAPPQIVALANRHLKSPSMVSQSEVFDPATLYSDSSPSASRHSLVASPISLQRSSTPPASTRTSLSMSPMQSYRSTNQYQLPVSNTMPMDDHDYSLDPDLVEAPTTTSFPPPTVPQSTQKKSGKLKKFGFGFGKMASKGTNGLKGVLGKGRLSAIDLLADPLEQPGDTNRIDAETVGKSITDGFIATVAPPQIQAGIRSSHLPYPNTNQDQDTNIMLRPPPRQGHNAQRTNNTPAQGSSPRPAFSYPWMENSNATNSNNEMAQPSPSQRVPLGTFGDIFSEVEAFMPLSQTRQTNNSSPGPANTNPQQQVQTLRNQSSIQSFRQVTMRPLTVLSPPHQA